MHMNKHRQSLETTYKHYSCWTNIVCVPSFILYEENQQVSNATVKNICNFINEKKNNIFHFNQNKKTIKINKVRKINIEDMINILEKKKIYLKNISYYLLIIMFIGSMFLIIIINKIYKIKFLTFSLKTQKNYIYILKKKHSYLNNKRSYFITGLFKTEKKEQKNKTKQKKVIEYFVKIFSQIIKKRFTRNADIIIVNNVNNNSNTNIQFTNVSNLLQDAKIFGGTCKSTFFSIPFDSFIYLGERLLKLCKHDVKSFFYFEFFYKTAKLYFLKEWFFKFNFNHILFFTRKFYKAFSFSWNRKNMFEKYNNSLGNDKKIIYQNKKDYSNK
ncbi:hypothetical protein RFI_04551 [Reticulomyxa filosa]|uniref:Uncharacterized protein n=1 Tax=Reticulomyxa filosa TaxID=46433 RepID=X6P1Z2_RETFI|nr:hypothetical protein RFI_04551 [Reticulomyxa filosa]|eukprot:ETO32565.1 hypothetical protein RFI_04551 [Reticulomyxa filosa]